MTPVDVVKACVDAFNEGDAASLGSLYAEDAVNHQLTQDLVVGRANIQAVFEAEFSAADMTRIIE